VMFDAARVQQETRLGRPPPFGGLHDFFLRHAGDALGPVEVVG
jgi:hypothetical protein